MSLFPAILGGDPVRSDGLPPWPIVDPGIQEVLAQISADGTWGRYHGPHTESLIRVLQDLHGVEHVLLTASGTAAVELALRGIGIQPAREVVLSAYDFKANFTNTVLLNARPVLVDIHERNGQLDADQLDLALTADSCALLVSHLHGACVDMPAIRSFADEHKLLVLEDACQMPGASIHGRVAGTWGDVGVLSFGGSKTLTAGRGGAILTNRPEIAQRIRLYTQRGNEAYPLSEIQAALLLPQVAQLRERQQLRAAMAAQVLTALQHFPFLRPFQPTSTCHADYYKLGFFYHQEHLQGLSRERFCQSIRAEGIPLDPGFRSLHKIHARSRFRAVGELHNATKIDTQVVVLHHPFLLSGSHAAAEFALALDKISSHATLLQNSDMTTDSLRTPFD